ncbi:T9SS type A sorting domain-containing protein [Winogradskyella immobilis]|uniref:T9SS type A sorting domain-containing protein n=1 Tax=Winogradskyella immobilis TaxID=2816852 RepID=A0ABS8EIL5_9FLAO|nr:T9SS type A sorting domain-containing protein [Winogradskyella immobilis]MCC1483046.1 T9SS type A sorting domain-containing protein [Winogradskyella immobilis]MCG0015141.1 T9SS type A sorting domain-containing protein [Winogradskyella immobilis]
MKKLYFLLFTFLTTSVSFGQDMLISGAFDGPLSGGLPKLVEIYVINDIADLSVYGFGSANNGGGTDGEELTFAGSANAGDFIYITSEGPSVMTYFGVTADYIDSSANINGDDALELFFNGAVIDTFGDINTDGTGQPWEYLDGGAYRISGTGPDGSTFDINNWLFTGPNAVDGCTTNATCDEELPIGSFSTTATAFISISSPSDMEELPPGTTSVDVVFTAANLQSGDEVNILVSTNGGMAMTFTNQTSPFTINSTSDGDTFEVTAEIVNGGSQIDFEIIDFSIGSATQVADIATLRASPQDGTFYELTGEVFLTFQRENFRGQKYIEDATGAVLIDDDNGIITTSYTVGDGITGILGRLGEFNGTIQFVPSVDPGAPSSTGNTITPQSVSLLDLTMNPETYESELVTVTAVTMDNSTPTFISSTEYGMTQGPDAFTFRSTFFEADYITQGGEVPTMPTDITGIINERSGNEYFLTARNTDDFSLAIVLSNDDFNVTNFSLYPNPTSTGEVTISTVNSGAISIMVYDILGKQVKNEALPSNGRLNVSSLKSGVYIMRITQDNATVTKKLVIR